MVLTAAIIEFVHLNVFSVSGCSNFKKNFSHECSAIPNVCELAILSSELDLHISTPMKYFLKHILV